MNNNLEFENKDPSPDIVENNHPRTNYGEGYEAKETPEEKVEKQIMGIDVDTGYRVPFKDLNLKKETLEETAEKLYPNGCDGTDRSSEIYRRIFIEGVKWQAERMYSEEQFEDMITIVFEMTNKGYSLKQIFTELKEQ